MFIFMGKFTNLDIPCFFIDRPTLPPWLVMVDGSVHCFYQISDILGLSGWLGVIGTECGLWKGYRHIPQCGSTFQILSMSPTHGNNAQNFGH